MSRNVGTIVSMLGTFEAGGGYVPVDPDFPIDRQTYILSHSKCRLVIVDEEEYDKPIKSGMKFPNIIVIDSKTGRRDSSIANNCPSGSLPPRFL